MVRALARMTEERMNTIIDALPRTFTNFLTKHCPQKPAKTETDIRYSAANISIHRLDKLLRMYLMKFIKQVN